VVGSEDAFARWQGQLQKVLGDRAAFQTAASFARTGRKGRGAMTRVLVGLVLGMALAAGWCVTAADDPPKELTPEQRKELEAKWKELIGAAGRSYQAGKLPEATEAATKALEIARRLYPKQDHPNLAASLYNLARMLLHQGRYADAETFSREALEMSRRLYAKQDHPLLAHSLTYMAAVLESRGKYADAETVSREALAMYRRLYPKGDRPYLAGSLNNLANVLRKQGKYADAEALYREALEIDRHLNPKQDHPDLANSLNNLAVVLGDQGKHADAEKILREALEMKRRLYPRQDHPDLALSLNNLAVVLQNQEKRADAETFSREALEMNRRLYGKQDHPDLAMSLNKLANVLWAQGKSADAETLYREALEMNRRLYGKQDHPDLPATLSNLALVLRDQGKYADAETFSREALEMCRRLYPQQDHPHLALSLNTLAVVLEEQGKYADAETFHREALAMVRRLHGKQNHPDLALSLTNLAGVLWFQGKYADAEPLLREALAVYRALGEACAGGGSEGDALTLASTYPLARDVFLSNARAMQAEPAGVYAEVWASKATLTRVYERRALAARAAATDPKAAALLDQLTRSRRRRADLLLAAKPTDPVTRKQRDEDLAGYARQIEALDRELRPLLPTVARAGKLAQAAPAELQKVLPADAAVVDFLRWTLFEQDPDVPGKKGMRRTARYLAFVLTRDKVAWLDLGPAAPLRAAVAAWREAITSGKEVPPALPARVRDLVWAKVRKELPAPVKVVYLCPDLALCRVPWAALPGDRPGTVLLEEYALATIPHAVFLLDKLWPPDAVRKRPADLLAVGGVAYDADLPTAGKAVGNRGAPLLKPGQKPQWDALPGAAAEAQGVRGAAKKKDLACRTIEGETATTAAVLAALPQAGVAHLATHGFFADASFRSAFQVDPKLFERTRRGERVGAGALSPMVMTGLVFAGANQPNTPGRGILTGEALVGLDLSGLELAVLSACETGLGDVAGGEGTFGLQRALHLAGTRDVVASLWKVPDRPTAALMALFYRNLWDKDMAPVEALRQAQLEVYRHPEKIPELAEGFRGKFVEVPGTEETPGKAGPEGKAHPRLWAAFTLSGPGR
jgi:CHAT domain-containing protein/tetratricopeptide (TPR) repeat protein